MNKNSFTVFFIFFVIVSTVNTVRSQSTFFVGSQEWMSANLDVDHYSDGTPIPEAKTKEEWKSFNENKIGCYCNYDNESCYGKMYGKLYNWYAVKRGLAPHCWKVASKNDFDILIAAIGSAAAAKKLKATHGWDNDWNGNNASGFGAFAGGCRNAMGTFSFVGWEGFWWTSDTRKTGTGRNGGVFLFINFNDKYDYDVSEDFGFSVRCMRYFRERYPLPCP